MSAVLPPSLVALGLTDPTLALDERTLRRAYARNLKLIDVEAEPERFQTLREHLDQALRWIAWRDQARQAAEAANCAEAATPDAARPAPAPAPTPSLEHAGPKPEESGAAVFASFHGQWAGMRQEAPESSHALQAALADERLLNIDARTFFEWNVAHLLAGGWRTGHEHLLEAAIDAFGWAQEHARLAHFGQVGALLSAAIRDRATFRALGGEQIEILERLIARVRQAVPPDAKALQLEVEQLQFLVQRVPHWLRIVSPVEPVNQRFEMWRQIQPVPPPPVPQPTPQFVSRRPASELGPAMLIMMVLIFLAGIASHNQQPARQASRPDPTPAELATDAQLLRRQRQAEVLLANVMAARQLPAPKQDGGRRTAGTAAMPPLPASLDTPWWQPRSPAGGGNARDQFPPLGTSAGK
jgi:hypothetical protein